MHDLTDHDPFEHPGVPPGSVRVVLVGRTGLDATLRLDRRVELIRARTPLSALGELASPIDAESPGTTVVVVGPDAVPAAAGSEPGRAAGFVAAVRRIDPEARVLAVQPNDDGAYDGAIPQQASGELVRALIHNGAQARAHEPPPQPTRELDQPSRQAPPIVPTAPSSHPQSSIPHSTDDLALLTTALRAGDLAGAALAQARSRLKSPDARFDPPSAAPADTSIHSVPVVFGSTNFGTLSAPGVPAQLLAAEASRLAAWIMLARQHEQLRAAAFTDELTGAWNRRYFRRFLGAAIEQARQARQPVTVLFFDIDDFKRYNDSFGHAAGDEILVNAVRLLTSVIRPSDRVCRIGGDEFAVIFHDPEGPRAPDAPGAPPDAGTADARPRPTFAPPTITEICQRFQKQICAHRFPQLAEDAPGRLSISGGLATYPWDGVTVDELLARADQLALQSKKQGKNAIILGPNGECARGD